MDGSPVAAAPSMGADEENRTPFLDESKQFAFEVGQKVWGTCEEDGELVEYKAVIAVCQPDGTYVVSWKNGTPGDRFKHEHELRARRRNWRPVCTPLRCCCGVTLLVLTILLTLWWALNNGPPEKVFVETKTITVNTTRPAQVVIMLDSSNSIVASDWNKSVTFAREVILLLNHTFVSSQVVFESAIGQFSTGTHMDIWMRDTILPNGTKIEPAVADRFSDLWTFECPDDTNCSTDPIIPISKPSA